MDSNSLTKTKNWSGRSEVTETSGRLHPLWSQNKWIHTPWTTDYRHTRQDRWIQKELAFTLAKNATKPNPFEIIPLQTTRKENDWKTEEALTRVAVTLETEWSNGPILYVDDDDDDDDDDDFSAYEADSLFRLFVHSFGGKRAWNVRVIWGSCPSISSVHLLIRPRVSYLKFLKEFDEIYIECLD